MAADARADEWTHLLASGGLEQHWKGYGQDDVPASWTLRDGVLSLEGVGGDLVTREEFTDFELRFEWKIAPGGNSGVLYRVAETDAPPYESGPEYQVIDLAYPNLTELTGPAALYGLYPSPFEAAKPAGEWNAGRIVISDGSVEHWLNGRQVVTAKLDSQDWRDRVAGSKFAAWEGFAQHAAGRISLQDHGSKVWYRHLQIKRLDAATGD